MNETLDRHWLLKSKTEIVALGWEKFMDHMKGAEVWIILPQDFEKILPAARHYFHAHMFGDGEINVFFSEANVDGGWQKDEVFYFSRYRFERYSDKSCTISSNMNAILADRHLPQISEKLLAEIDAKLIGEWGIIDPHDNRKRFW